MPELPEVETVCRTIATQVVGHTVTQVVIRQPRLRWVIPADLATLWVGQTIQSVARRAKYLLLGSAGGTAIFHLGMTGRLRTFPSDSTLEKHDHVDIQLSNQTSLRFNDSRRFGALLWSADAPEQHPLLARLGMEPFAPIFSGAWLYEQAQRRSLAVKQFIMDQQVVVGVGNIYASEALFQVGIAPQRPASTVSLREYERLAVAIQDILQQAIAHGGSTVRDFQGGDGKAGSFQQQLKVYGRAQQACHECGTLIARCRLGQRSTYYCPQCQS